MKLVEPPPTKQQIGFLPFLVVASCMQVVVVLSVVARVMCLCSHSFVVAAMAVARRAAVISVSFPLACIFCPRGPASRSGPTRSGSALPGEALPTNRSWGPWNRVRAQTRHTQR